MSGDGLSRSERTVIRLPAIPASPAAVVLRNCRVVLPEQVRDGTLVVRDGLIQAVVATAPSRGHTIDCEGDFVLPGLIEPHTDNFERHLEPRPGTFWSAHRAVLSHDAELAAAGITTACDAISLGNEINDEAVQHAHEVTAAIATCRSQGLLRVDHHLHFRCELSSPRLRDELERAMAASVPRLVSLMDHTPGQGQWNDVARFRKHYAGRFGLAADQLDELIARRQRTRLRFAAENRLAAVTLATKHGCILASHDDSSDADIERAREDSCTIAEFPTSLQVAREARRRGMHVVAGAPNLVRGGSHSGNVPARELLEHGACDILSSDYYPPSLLQAAFMLSRTLGLPLPHALESVTSAPARALGLCDRGCIEAGRRADLVRVRETAHGPVVISAWCAGRQVA